VRVRVDLCLRIAFILWALFLAARCPLYCSSF